MKAILILFAIIVAFSLLTIAELSFLHRQGFDIIAHLKVTHKSGKKYQFFFEAFGVIAFVIGQPIFLSWLLVWMSNNINPQIFKSLLNVLPIWEKILK